MPEWKQQIREHLAGLRLAPVREAEIIEELSQHLEDRYALLRAGGASEDDARRATLEELERDDSLARQLRQIERAVEQEPVVLGAEWKSIMGDLWQDIRYAVRMLGKNPGFAAVAVLTLALGIGANTVVFSVVNAVLLRPLPYAQSDHLVKVWGNFAGIGLPNNLNWISAPEFKDLESQNKSFSHVAALSTTGFNLNLGGRPQRVEGSVVSPSLFPLLGVQAASGRTFLPEESQPGRDRVVVLSYGLWKRGFGGEPGIVGRKLELSGLSYEVVGVMPPGFQYPDGAEMWVPLAFQPDALTPNNRSNHGLEVLARIKPGLTLEQARADMTALTKAVEEQNRDYPYARVQFAFVLTPLLDEMVADVKKALWILTGAITLVLLIACANVASLLLVRASSREREIAIRMALGADRRRLVRQLLTESVLLALLGGAAGLGLARWGLGILVGLSATVFPRVGGAAIDGTVLAFTMLVSLGTGIVFGMAPALRCSRGVRHESLKDSARSSTTRLSSQRLRQCLVVAEFALSLVLLDGAGLLVKSFLRLQEVDPGFRPDHVLTMRVSLPTTKYARPEQVRAFYRDALDRVSALPGVQAAGAINGLPLSTSGSSGTTTMDTQAVAPDQASPEADWRVATPSYFKALGISLVRGRDFDERDTDVSPPVVVVDETLANTYWPNEDPIGKRLHRGGRAAPDPRWATVVGVVRHVRCRTLEALSRVQVYWPAAQRPAWSMSLAVRTSSDPGALAGAVQKEILAVDPDQPIYRVRTMEEWLESSLARRRLSMLLLSIFAGAALLLSAVGIYGVISYWVSQRTREMGIRMALGAARADLLRLVLHQSVVLAGAGVVLGFAGSLAVNRLLSSLLFNVKPNDPLIFLTVAVGLAAVALLASFLPAHRATRVHPIVALRYE
jgi:predicted permease